MARILNAPITRGLVVESPHPSLDARLAEYGLTVEREDAVPDDAALIAAIQRSGAQVLFKRSRVPVTRAVLDACPTLHAVQLCCIGDDSVDKVAAADHGVLVFNDPVSNGRSVVELAIGHMISLCRRLYETNAQMSAHDWQKNDRQRFEVLGKRLGIVGLGSIGRQVARAASALGLEIWFYDNRFVAQEVGEEMGWRRAADLDELFSQVDIVSVHTSSRDYRGRDNEGLLDPHLSALGRERPDASPRVFLNLARGNVHSVEAMRAAVATGAIRRGAVDVYPEEPAPGAASWTNPYADLRQVVCTPHIGAATQEAQPRIARRVSRTMGEFATLGTLRDCVFSPRLRLTLNNIQPGNAVLAVVHSTTRGTKKAVADAIYEQGASTISSTQFDFPTGVAYDLSLIDRQLPDAELAKLVIRAKDLADDPNAIRAVRQMVASSGSW